VQGYDISHHQTATPDLSGVGFVIVRASYGSSVDERYDQHVANVRAAGKVAGAYIFARPNAVDPVDKQVATFLRVSAGADFLAVDREKDGTNGIITATDTRRMITMIQAAGRRVGLYASESAFKDFGQDWSWVAHWGTEPVIPYDVWQWDGGGTDKVDNDVFRGSVGALLALGSYRDEYVDALSAQLAQTTAELADETWALDAETTRTAALTKALDAETARTAALTRAVAALDAQLAAEKSATSRALAVLRAAPAVVAADILGEDRS
jgi:hypothetical protein